MNILDNMVGLTLIALIVWWFWLYRPQVAQATSGAVAITVDYGVYSPGRVSVKSNEPVVLRFLRKDPSPCAAMDLRRPRYQRGAAGRKTKEISLMVAKPGTYACQMKMYRGELVVEG
jgi:plastocyanin domain-containing protein